MDFGLTLEQKLATLNSAKAGIQSEIYSTLIRMGIDPDAFNAEDALPTEDSFVGEKARVRMLIDSLALIESKITELS
jgi:hypothetical protein